jgi:hypothetical protein
MRPASHGESGNEVRYTGLPALGAPQVNSASREATSTRLQSRKHGREDVPWPRVSRLVTRPSRGIRPGPTRGRITESMHPRTPRGRGGRDRRAPLDGSVAMVPETEEVSDGVIEPGEELRVQSRESGARLHESTLLVTTPASRSVRNWWETAVREIPNSNETTSPISPARWSPSASTRRCGGAPGRRAPRTDGSREEATSKPNRRTASVQRQVERYQLIGSALPSS